MRYFVTLEGKERAIDVSELPGGSFDVRLADTEGTGARTSGVPLEVDAKSAGGALTVRVGGRVYDLVLDGKAPTLSVYASGRRAMVSVESAHQRAAAKVRSGDRAGGNKGLIASPMPGKVVKVLVKEGDEVETGKPIVVVEAMKMENELVAETTGVVQKVYVQPGDAVEGGARLVLIG
jgi:biotin carboxyl carrier protein